MTEKVDVAEYLKSHSGEEFKTLFDTAVSVWTLKLSVQPTGDSAVESVKVAQKFIAEELSQMNAAERVAFIESDVKAHFGLADDVISELVRIGTRADG